MADRRESDGDRRWRLFLWLCAALRGDRPEWPADPADTQPLIALAGDHFITPALAVALDGTTGLPDPVREYLGAVLMLNRERNRHILAAVDSAAACHADAGIPAVFLKGAAQLADGLYSDPGARFLGDVDVLVPRLAAPAAARALADAGFADADAPMRHWVSVRHHHLPLQRHVESGVGIEVHRELLDLTFPDLVSSDAVIRSAVPARLRPDVLVPTPPFRALHAIIHDQLNHGWRRRRCGLRTLCDVARLLMRPNADRDLEDLARDLRPSARRIVNHLVASAGLVGAPVDPEATRIACARLRLGMTESGYGVPDWLAEGFARVRSQPLVAINLLDPRPWPKRLARIWS